jgi:hypothetical protein
MDPRIRGYISTVNQALRLFNPSNEEYFSKVSYIAIYIDEKELLPGEKQRDVSLHFDCVPGFVGTDGKLYDGNLVANNVDGSLLIVPTSVITTEEVDVLEDCQRAKSLFKDELIYAEAAKFYFIGPFTPHEPLPVKEKVYRQVILVSLGDYHMLDLLDSLLLFLNKHF